MGIFDWMFLKNVSEENETEEESAEDESDDDGDDRKEDRAIAAAIDGANSLDAKDWYAQEQHEAYVAIADAALAVKKRNAARRATAKPQADQDERDRARRAQAEPERVGRQRERDSVRTPTGGRSPAADSRRREHPAPPPGIGHWPLRAERVPQGVEEGQAAATRLANAQAAQLEAQTALLRAQAEAAMRAVAAELAPVASPKARIDVAPTGPKPPSGSPSGSGPSAPALTIMAAHPAMSSGSRTADAEFSEADRLALVSVGRWPPTPMDRRGPFWSRADDYPAEWTLTGFELANFRGGVSVTRSVLAAQLGVSVAEIKDAETRPKVKVGPALQIALRRAIDLVAERRQRRRAEAEATAATAQPERGAKLPVLAALVLVAPMETAADVAPPATYTGSDLARLRAARHLSQRAMAQLLGVEQGTISKGEGKAGAALGPALQEAIGRLAGRGGAGGEAENLE